MLKQTLQYFNIYKKQQAPFMHEQLLAWTKHRPLEGLSLVHNIPVVANTLLKIACCVAAGAKVTVVNPSFMTAKPEAISALQQDGIRYEPELSHLKGESFDLYLDCNAETYQALGAPRIGAVELTASGDYFYRSEKLSFPVISIDPTFTKQLETIFGTSESAGQALKKLSNLNLANTRWLVFGFGKIGRGVAHYCLKHNIPVCIADINPAARQAAVSFGITAIDPNDHALIQQQLAIANVIITATGKHAILNHYPKAWFANKTLANLGAHDEFGEQFAEEEVLNQKRPINFILDDPTPIIYIDPVFYAHNIAAIELLQSNLTPGVTKLSHLQDTKIIDQWCEAHQFSQEDMMRWFMK